MKFVWQISRPICEWCEFGQVFNGQLEHLYVLIPRPFNEKTHYKNALIVQIHLTQITDCTFQVNLILLKVSKNYDQKMFVMMYWFHALRCSCKLVLKRKIFTKLGPWDVITFLTSTPSLLPLLTWKNLKYFKQNYFFNCATFNFTGCSLAMLIAQLRLWANFLTWWKLGFSRGPLKLRLFTELNFWMNPKDGKMISGKLANNFLYFFISSCLYVCNCWKV